MRAGHNTLMRGCAIFFVVALGACGGEAGPPLVASDLVINEPIPGSPMSSGYLSLRNNTGDAIEITKVSSPDYAAVEIHESIIEDNVAKMRKLETLSIPAQSTLALKPGGRHLMLMRPAKPVDEISLSFFSGDALLLSVKAPISKRQN